MLTTHVVHTSVVDICDIYIYAYMCTSLSFSLSLSLCLSVSLALSRCVSLSIYLSIFFCFICVHILDISSRERWLISVSI